MTVVQKSIKTFSTIHIDESDFLDLVTYYLYNPNSFDRDCYPKAFEQKEKDNSEWIEFMQNWITSPNKDTYDYIANHYGFDGWENAGYYNKSKRCVVMVMYTWGGESL